MHRFPRYFWLLIVCSGLLQVVPFPMGGPAPAWTRLIAWICLTPLLYVLVSGAAAVGPGSGEGLRLRSAALLSYVCGVIWYLGNCYWIYRTMHIYGDLPVAASLGILLLFSTYLGLYHGLFGILLALVRQRTSRNTALLAAPFLWVAVELARTKITGFPWDLIGYTQVDSLTLTRLAPFTGVMGLSFLVVLVNAIWLLRLQVPDRKTLYAGAAGVLACAVVLMVLLRQKREETFLPTETATLVQVNLGVGAEAAPVRETQQEMLTSFVNLSLHPLVVLPEHPVSSLVVWPEAPTDFLDDDPNLRGMLSSLAVRARAPVIVNDVSIASRNQGGRPALYNSAAVYNAAGTYVGRYDKMHLVPFGEYTPYKPLFFFAGHLLDSLAFVPGMLHTIFPLGGKTYGVFICYESIFADDIRKLALDGAQVLVNISDDGWYGDTSAPFEHFDMVRMRAIENHRWLIRATNTGITAAIDPLGRVTATYPRHIRGSMQVGFGLESETTFYTRHGYWFAWICVLIGALYLVQPKLKQRSRTTK